MMSLHGMHSLFNLPVEMSNPGIISAAMNNGSSAGRHPPMSKNSIDMFKSSFRSMSKRDKNATMLNFKRMYSDRSLSALLSECENKATNQANA